MLKKLRRTATSLLPVSKDRRGNCNQCGACCKLPFECPFLKTFEDGSYECNVYFLRPPNCRKYPRSFNEHITQDSCGFFFENGGKSGKPGFSWKILRKPLIYLSGLLVLVRNKLKNNFS